MPTKVSRQQYKERMQPWNFYLEVLKAGRAFYGNRPGALARAYRELGKFHEVSAEHVQRMWTVWTPTVN